MRRLALCVVVVCVFSAVASAGERDAVSYVNPLIGTQKSATGYGGTMPFVSPPFGMTDWTPQTRQNKISVTSYNYADEGNELPVEMTATERCAMFRFRFPKSGVARVLVETSRPGVPGYAAIDAQSHEITGYNPHRMDAHLGPNKLPNFKGYFVIQFRQVPQDAKTYGMDDERAESSRGAYAEFRPGETVEVRVGTSFLSIDQARDNLKGEMPKWDFEGVRQRLRATWNEKLGRMQVEGATEREKTRLYTALYHALLYPRIFSEGGHYYSAFDDHVHEGESYTAYSIWDTFRAEN